MEVEGRVDEQCVRDARRERGVWYGYEGGRGVNRRVVANNKVKKRFSIPVCARVKEAGRRVQVCVWK